jgi:cellulose synthase/poly-beta-1,6-N-acetylglucosamine synthase-like glycosyltransferase
MAELILWGSFLTLLYIAVGYPASLVLLSAVIRDRVDKGECYPTVTLLVPAYNEEECIEEKIKNSLAIDYPAERLEVLVASDGSTDRTPEIAQRYDGAGIRFIDYKERGGKTALLNKTVPEATGEIVVFSDTSSMIDAEGFKELIFNFNDRRVGSVSGSYRIGFDATSARDQGESVYWVYETFMKKKESETGSTIGAHGAFYAIRKELFGALEEGIINDDFIIPARVVMQGYRAVYEPAAMSWELTRASSAGEFRRRVRIVTGNIQQIVVLRGLFTSGLMGAWQFFSHKVLRVFLPVFTIALFASNAVLATPFYRATLAAQAAFYALGLATLVFRPASGPIRILTSLPYYVILLNAASVGGIFNYIVRGSEVTWNKTG